MIMRWTKEQYDAYQARRAWNRRSAVVQEFQDDRSWQADNQSKKTKMDAAMHQRYRVSVTLLVADERDRDGDGMYSTIQDCLIAAVGRLVKMDRIALRKLAKSEERRRGL